MKRATRIIFTGLVLLLGLAQPLLAQLGMADRIAPQQFLNYGDAKFYVCTYASTVSNCAANAISIYADRAGAVPISQASGVTLTEHVQFFASPGLWRILYSSAKGGKYLDSILVGADFNPATASNALIHQASVTLDNDQIIHLPSTAIQIVAAPGSGKFISVVGAAAVVDIATGKQYSNFDASSSLGIALSFPGGFVDEVATFYQGNSSGSGQVADLIGYDGLSILQNWPV